MRQLQPPAARRSVSLSIRRAALFRPPKANHLRGSLRGSGARGVRGSAQALARLEVRVGAEWRHRLVDVRRLEDLRRGAVSRVRVAGDPKSYVRLRPAREPGLC